MPNVNSGLVIGAFKRLCIRCLFVLLEYEAVGQNSGDMCFFNYKSCTGVSFLTGALFEQEKTIKHFTDEAATRDRQPVPHKTTELYKLS